MKQQRKLNVIWASDWDDDLNEPTGTMHDLGECDEDGVWLAIFQGHVEASMRGWPGCVGEGDDPFAPATGGVYLLDHQGDLVDVADVSSSFATAEEEKDSCQQQQQDKDWASVEVMLFEASFRSPAAAPKRCMTH